MIRREVRNSAGEPAWMLITQVDHAHLAWQLAEHWVEPISASPTANADLLAAIRCHDDGWAAWERHPKVDPESGHPIDFTEMNQLEAIGIWQASIAVGARESPFTAWLVSRHFEELLRRSHWAESKDEQVVHNGEAFLHSQVESQHKWLTQWQASQPSLHTEAVAAAGLTLLQHFDLLSLWFCCSEKEQLLRLEMPSGGTLNLEPQPHHRVGIRPWRADTDPYELSIAGRVVPQRHYNDDQELANAASEPATIRWTLVPPDNGDMSR